MSLLKYFDRLVQQNTIIYSTINSKSLLSKPPTDTTMVYCKAQTEDYIKKYCFLYYFLQIGIVVFVACIVVFTIGFQKLQHSNSKTGALSKQYTINQCDNVKIYSYHYKFKQIYLHMSNCIYNTSVAQDESQEITNTTSQEEYKLIIKPDLRSKKNMEH